MNQLEQKPRIFVCYSKKDANDAAHLARDLEKYLPAYQVELGSVQNSYQSGERESGAGSVFIVLLTQQYNKSKQREDDFNAAQKANAPIFPVLTPLNYVRKVLLYIVFARFLLVKGNHKSAYHLLWRIKDLAEPRKANRESLKVFGTLNQVSLLTLDEEHDEARRLFAEAIHDLEKLKLDDLTTDMLDLYRVCFAQGYMMGNRHEEALLLLQGKTDEFFSVMGDDIISHYPYADAPMENATKSPQPGTSELETVLNRSEREIQMSLEWLLPADQQQVLINVLSKLNHEARSRVLEELILQSTPEALDPKVEAAIDATIEDIHLNERGASTDTLYERALMLFKKQGKAGVTLACLENIGMQVQERYQAIAARKLIQRLRPKLQRHGYTIRHQRYSGKSLYDIIPRDN